VEEGDEADVAALFATNFFGPVALIKAVPRGRARLRGRGCVGGAGSRFRVLACSRAHHHAPCIDEQLAQLRLVDRAQPNPQPGFVFTSASAVRGNRLSRAR
jgi:hypothetical protein